jgi:hypothetical protein
MGELAKYLPYFWRPTMNRSALFSSMIALLALGLVMQCSVVARESSKDDSAAAKALILNEEPKDAKGVIETRAKAKDKGDVIVVGRIGGRKNPWVKGAAAFSIVDTSLKACNERPGDTCPTPWDFCCEANLPKQTVFVTVVDDKTGKTLKQDAREALKLHELETVVVQGKARRDKNGNVTIAASKIYVRPEKEATK